MTIASNFAPACSDREAMHLDPEATPYFDKLTAYVATLTNEQRNAVFAHWQAAKAHDANVWEERIGLAAGDTLGAPGRRQRCRESFEAAKGTRDRMRLLGVELPR